MITPLAKYKAFKKICQIVGLDEDEVAGLIRGRATKGKRVTIHFTNRDTGLVFTLIVDQFSWNDEHAIRLYERHPEGSIEIMAKKILLAKPPRARPTPRRKAEPGLSEIVGVFVIISIVIGAGGAFYYATLDRVDTVTSENIVDIYGLRLIAFIPDDGSTETDTVYAEMTISLLYVENVILGGDVLSVNSEGAVLFNNTVFHPSTLLPFDESPIRYSCHYPKLDDNCQAVKSKDGVAIHYSGRLVLDEKKKIGDAVDIIVEYRDQSRTVNTVVEEN